MDRCGWLWVVLGHFGSFWVVPRFSNYAAKRTKLGRFTPKYPEVAQQMLEWFLDQRDQGEY